MGWAEAAMIVAAFSTSIAAVGVAYTLQLSKRVEKLLKEKAELERTWSNSFGVLQKRLADNTTALATQIEKYKEHCLRQDKVFARSASLRHSELTARIQLLEELHENELKEYRERSAAREKQAAKEADEAYGQ